MANNSGDLSLSKVDAIIFYKYGIKCLIFWYNYIK